MNNSELLTTSQAAEILGVSDETVRRWASERKIRHRRTPAGQLRFTRQDLESVFEVVEPEVQAS